MKEKFKTDTFEANTAEVMEELKELFYFSPPSQIKEYLLEVLFTYLIELHPQDYPETHCSIIENFYFLNMFLTKMEKINESANLTGTDNQTSTKKTPANQ
ncbi:MAG TPA: hypothetical protein VNB90_15155 [Cytophagaceae bacterium]|jgi:hypothetical protein|nr:hypothetical protein [Cytophagaceae bacterium]